MNPVLALIIANTVWGAAAPIFKFALDNIPPFTLAFSRFFFASLIFLPFISLSKIYKLTRSDWIRLILASFFGISLNISFFFLGLQKTDSINAPIIASSGPLFLFLGAVFFLHEKVKIHVIFGMLISFIGVLTIVISPLLFNGNLKQDVLMVEGNILYIIATVVSIVAPLLIKDVLKKVDVLVVTFITFFIGSIFFIPFMLYEFQTWSIFDLEFPGLIGIIYGVFFSSALAYYLHYYAIRKMSIQEIGVFTYIDPIVAVLIAIPLLSEYPDIFFFLGSVLVFGGIYMSEGRIHYHPFHRLRNKY